MCVYVYFTRYRLKLKVILKFKPRSLSKQSILIFFSPDSKQQQQKINAFYFSAFIVIFWL